MTMTSGGSGEGTSNPVKIFTNIFISFIGAGVLGLPYAFKTAGILEGLLVMITVSFFSVRAMLLLVDCKYTILKRFGTGTTADRSPLMVQHGGVSKKKEKRVFMEPSVHASLSRKNSTEEDDIDAYMRERKSRLVAQDDLTYGDVGMYAFGLRGKAAVDVAIVISQLGFCCAYLIFITENLSSYFSSVHKETWLLMILPFLYLMTLYRQLHKLAFFSLFAQISNLFAFGVVFWFDFDHIAHATRRIHPKHWSLEGFPFFFAVSIYCYEGAGMILALEHSLAKPVRHQFKQYFLVVISIVTTLYLTFGVCGYLSFGPHTNAIITLNLPRGSGGLDSAMLVKLSLSTALFFTYPLMMFPVTQLLQKTIFPTAVGGIVKPSGRRYFGENVLRLALVFGTGMIVICIPSFADLMALIGASCCTLLAFILPAAFHARLHQKTITKPELYLDYWLAFMGIVGAVIGTLDTLNRIWGEHGVESLASVEEEEALAEAFTTSLPSTTDGLSSATSDPYERLSTVSASIVDSITTQLSTKLPSSSAFVDYITNSPETESTNAVVRNVVDSVLDAMR